MFWLEDKKIIFSYTLICVKVAHTSNRPACFSTEFVGKMAPAILGGSHWIMPTAKIQNLLTLAH